MQVLFLSSWFPSQKHPFNGNFVIRHAEAAARYHSVTILNVTDDPLSDKSPLDILPEINLWEVALKPCRLPLLGKAIDKLKKIYHLGKAISKLKAESRLPDIVHVNVIYPIGLFAIYLKWSYKIPFIITEHWTGYLPRRYNELSRLHKLAARFICSRAAFVCPVSENLATSMQQLGLKGNYRVVPNVVRIELFKPTHPELHQPVRFIHVSTLNDDQKNIKGLLRVFKKLSNNYDFELIFISDKSKAEALQYSQEIGFPQKSILFRGPSTPSNIAASMETSDLFVLFSRYENLPCVIAEAHAAGIPVVSTNVGGIAEMVDPDNGRLIDSEDEEALYAQLKAFMDGKCQFDNGLIQQRAIKRYSYDEIGKCFSELYNKAVAKKDKPR